MTNLHVDIVSDIACPWCAIGYARLEQAMATLAGELELDIEWHAFELNPNPESKPQPILQALSRKYGRSEAEMEAAQANMIEVATGLGLNFSKMQERYTANTFNGHRLVKWAAEQGKQTAMKQALFDAYFGHAENVEDTEVLLRCVESIGLDTEAAQQVLDSDAFADAVRSDEARYQQAGVSSVPAFIVNNQYLISGAQEPAYLVEALREIAQQK
ncbi:MULTISPECIES: DsbA family oxidoreductase [Pseudomonas]|uniref:DsbA family oxidoreductase n=1 Tax=Pseudomonas neustonica TaxID=2487346 RepID=A0ABX9XMM1_9PSED|nr:MULTISPECIES: DsbA family oxidoreductase [Pseudomonas]MBA6420400.1 DsbA family oxidoreductase [Pseudomonas sp. 5Ae-yellow]ROZ87086.1 DsbA family oxidoreductase [Pseudomonas sp. SSM44]ROZ88298.1 DsbA family oxidoreductase [Pseudomonas neustonica]|tara:strand:+ start:444 stop:1088 length:645 start_codon:yes stop_codon:yes gene_type:complete